MLVRVWRGQKAHNNSEDVAYTVHAEFATKDRDIFIVKPRLNEFLSFAKHIFPCAQVTASFKKEIYLANSIFFSKSDDRAFPACTMGVARPQKYKKRTLLQAACRGRKGNPPPGEAGHVDGGR